MGRSPHWHSAHRHCFTGPPQASLELLQAELVVVGMDKDAADLAMRCEHLHLSPLSLLVAKQHTALAAAPACLRRPLPLTAAAAAVLAELCNAGTGPLCLRLLSLGAPMPGLLERSSHKPSSTHLKRLLPPLQHYHRCRRHAAGCGAVRPGDSNPVCDQRPGLWRNAGLLRPVWRPHSRG